MKKTVLLLLLIASLLSGCKNNNAAQVEPANSSIRLLAYTGDNYSNVILHPATWNIRTGEIKYDSDAAVPLVLSGQDYSNVILSWNGKNSFLINDRIASIEEMNEGYEFNRYDYWQSSKLYYCNGFFFEVSNEYNYIFTKDKDEYHFHNVEGKKLESGDNIDIGDNAQCAIIGAGYWNEHFIVLYAYYGEHTDSVSLFSIAFSSVDATIQSSDLIVLPEDASGDLLRMYYSFGIGVAYVNGRFYFCDDKIVRYYDIASSEFGTLAGVLETVEKIIPDATLSKSEMGKFVNTQIIGNTDDVVVYLSYFSSADNEDIMYFAVREETLLGIIKLNLSDREISTYDHMGRLLLSNVIPNNDLQPTFSLGFERTTTDGTV